MPRNNNYMGADAAQLRERIRQLETQCDSYRRSMWAAQAQVDREYGRAAAGVIRPPTQPPRDTSTYAIKHTLAGVQAGLAASDKTLKRALETADEMLDYANERGHADIERLAEDLEPLRKMVKTSDEITQCPITLDDLTAENVVIGAGCLHTASKEGVEQLLETAPLSQPNAPFRCPICRKEGWMTREYFDKVEEARAQIVADKDKRLSEGSSSDDQDDSPDTKLDKWIAEGNLQMLAHPNRAGKVCAALGPQARKGFGIFKIKETLKACSPKFFWDAEHKLWMRDA